jgi:GrpB-like predicted nucleotidyltransferase (UPF0157 family)
MFAAEKARLIAALCNLNIVVEHVGSTSVPGLAAKPTIDLAVGICDFNDASTYIPKIEALGYVYLPRLVEVLPNRRFFWEGSAQEHKFHIQLVEHLGSDWCDLIDFRNHLRSYPSQAAAYEAVKRRLAQGCGSDIGAYVHGKADIYHSILVDARRWHG